jgi:lipopolysaccharide transport system ATP-binding protein
MSTAIKVENLSKIYRLGDIGTGTITKDIDRWFKTKVMGKEDPFLKIGEINDRSKKGIGDIVYSLQDINFEINQGDAVGIIGRNGAGKSTLLKILSRVTTPTTGKINIKGRVASLLEVGTGFHPELSGRENIYLNGAILGMRKREIDRKLDEIIDFSGVERYIDTPVKRYSSGMYVRLAFAVAAHLESEILIVDEVLAVGDAEFQKKCLGKMGDVSKGEGRTVLFVSHNMVAIKSLCEFALSLQNGNIDYNGNVIDAINNYQITINKKCETKSLEFIQKRSGNRKVLFSLFHVENIDGENLDLISSGQRVYFVFRLKINDQNIGKIDLGFSVHNIYGDMITYLYSSFQQTFFESNGDDYMVIKCCLDEFPFGESKVYVKGRILVDGEEADWPADNIGELNVEKGDFYRTGTTITNIAPILIKGKWISN